jgi:hypothetical protein
VTERLPPVGTQVHRCLYERRRGSAQSGDHVVEDDDDAERRVADDDRPDPELEAEVAIAEVDRGRQRDRRDDPRQRDRQDEDERDRLSTEESEAVHRERRARAEEERDDRGPGGRLERTEDRRTEVGVLPCGGEPPRRPQVGRPPARDALAERVQGEDDDRDVQEQQRDHRPALDEEAREPGFHAVASYLASKAPNLRAIARYSAMITIGTVAKAAASGRLLARPTRL